ncbi:MAG: monovalent cation/H+ antiporter complex subunit F [Breznakiellaceae bacterium]
MKEMVLLISEGCLAVGILIAIVRVLRGPRGSDRLAALSVISSFVLALLVLFGVYDGRVLYLDVALVYDIFGFLGILAISRIIGEKQKG